MQLKDKNRTFSLFSELCWGLVNHWEKTNNETIRHFLFMIAYLPEACHSIKNDAKVFTGCEIARCSSRLCWNEIKFTEDMLEICSPVKRGALFFLLSFVNIQAYFHIFNMGTVYSPVKPHLCDWQCAGEMQRVKAAPEMHLMRCMLHDHPINFAWCCNGGDTTNGFHWHAIWDLWRKRLLTHLHLIWARWWGDTGPYLLISQRGEGKKIPQRHSGV